MKSLLITVVIAILPSAVLSAEYKIAEFDPITNYGSQFLELQIVSENGKTFNEILGTLYLSKDDLSVRILGVLPYKTQEELIAFYKREIPDVLSKSLKSSGNLHNPALSPLIRKFPDAFKNTVMYSEIEKTLKIKGYSPLQIDFEKFSINNKEISVPDILIKFKKNTLPPRSAESVPSPLSQALAI